MYITSYKELSDWFQNIQRDEKPATHWNLYNLDAGSPSRIATRNVKIDDYEESMRLLLNQVRTFNNPAGTHMRLQVYPKGAPNNPAGDIRLSIFGDHPALGDHGSNGGISGLPALAGGDIQTYIAGQVKLALLEKENEELREAMNGPNNMWERMVQTVADSPHLSQVVNNLVVGLVTKVNPAAAPHMQTTPPPMNGHPTTDELGDDTEDPQSVFYNNINAVSQSLGVDPITLSAKLNKLVRDNPEMAKQLLTNA